MAFPARGRHGLRITKDRGFLAPVSGDHLQTRLRTGPTGLSALLAMCVLMLPTLFGTCSADIHANTAKRHNMIAFQRHELGHQATQGRTLHIQLDASAHHRKVVFVQTACGTVLAGYGTLITGINTILMFGMHIRLLMLISDSRHLTFALSRKINFLCSDVTLGNGVLNSVANQNRESQIHQAIDLLYRPY